MPYGCRKETIINNKITLAAIKILRYGMGLFVCKWITIEIHMTYIFLRHLICNYHISGWNKSPLSVPVREKGFKFVVSIFSMGFTPVDFCATEFEINFSWQSKRFYHICIIIFLFSSFCPSPPVALPVSSSFLILK
jgi:hypothetical protein